MNSVFQAFRAMYWLAMFGAVMLMLILVGAVAFGVYTFIQALSR